MIIIVKCYQVRNVHSLISLPFFLKESFLLGSFFPPLFTCVVVPVVPQVAVGAPRCAISLVPILGNYPSRSRTLDQRMGYPWWDIERPCVLLHRSDFNYFFLPFGQLFAFPDILDFPLCSKLDILDFLSCSSIPLVFSLFCLDSQAHNVLDPGKWSMLLFFFVRCYCFL